MNWADYVYYDESSSTCLRWKVDIMWGANRDQIRCAKGSTAGTKNSYGYYRVTVTPEGRGRTSNVAHHIVWWLHGQEIPEGYEIDHKDGDEGNNRFSNLRAVTKAVNGRNKRKTKGREGIACGVYWRESKPGRHVAVATWYELDGRQRTKVFSVSKYGLLPSYAKAVEAREQAISRLNAEGADYTERHGR
jgi:hypothetical protein